NFIKIFNPIPVITIFCVFHDGGKRYSCVSQFLQGIQFHNDSFNISTMKSVRIVKSNLNTSFLVSIIKSVNKYIIDNFFIYIYVEFSRSKSRNNIYIYFKKIKK